MTNYVRTGTAPDGSRVGMLADGTVEPIPAQPQFVKTGTDDKGNRVGMTADGQIGIIEKAKPKTVRDVLREAAINATEDTPSWMKGMVAMGRGLNRVGQGGQQLYAMAADAIAPRDKSITSLVTGQDNSRLAEVNKEIANQTELFNPFKERVSGAGFGEAVGEALPTLLLPAGKIAQGVGKVVSTVAPKVGQKVAQSVAADAAGMGAVQGGVTATDEGESHLGNAVKGAAAGAGTVGLLNLAGKAVTPIVRKIADAVNPLPVKGAGLAKAGELTQETVRALEKEGIDVPSLTAEARTKLAKLASEAVEGAAITPKELARAARLESLPVPISGTKGQLSKDFMQNQAEQSLVKTGAGDPLRQKFADQDEKLIANLDKFRANTGAKVANEGDAGRSIDAALRGRIDKSEKNISALYRDAEKKGETMATIDLAPLAEHLNKNPGANPYATSQLKEMRLLKADEFGNLTPTHNITLNDLERVRQRASKVSGTATDGTTRYDAGQLVKQIDSIIPDDAGGKAYQAARAARRQHAMDFEEPAIVQNIVGMKSATDRATAFEDVFKKSVINGSVDDLKLLKQTLLHNDPQTREAGVQALKDMRGQAMQFLKDAATNNAHGDTSEAALRRAYNQIGPEKMDELFGRNVSKQFSNFMEAVKDLKVAPKGTQNPSGTAGEIVNYVDRILGAVGGRLGTAAAKGVRKLTESAHAAGKVEEAVNPMGAMSQANKDAALAQQNERLRALMDGPAARKIKSFGAAVGAAAGS